MLVVNVTIDVVLFSNRCILSLKAPTLDPATRGAWTYDCM
jgi:hypothetical protein